MSATRRDATRRNVTHRCERASPDIAPTDFIYLGDLKVTWRECGLRITTQRSHVFRNGYAPNQKSLGKWNKTFARMLKKMYRSPWGNFEGWHVKWVSFHCSIFSKNFSRIHIWTTLYITPVWLWLTHLLLSNWYESIHFKKVKLNLIAEFSKRCCTGFRRGSAHLRCPWPSCWPAQSPRCTVLRNPKAATSFRCLILKHPGMCRHLSDNLYPSSLCT